MTNPCLRCGLLHPPGTPCFALTLQDPNAAGALRTGTLLAGHYRIERVIHRGGMSIVYLAEDTRQGRLIALKEMHLPQQATPEEQHEAEGWFARESFLLSMLRYPLIPAFYGSFRKGGSSYIVQEYVEGESLETLVARQGPLDEGTVLAWGRTLCALLGYLHYLPTPVIFRDLKPANILLRAGSGQLAVVDFGIARPYLPGVVGTVIGTPGYAPPEQYQGLATPQSDIYALGATLYRLLTGYDPEHATPFAFAPVRQLNPAVSPMLAALVERAVRLNPAERQATAAEMDRELAAAARQRPGGGFGAAGYAGATPRARRSGVWLVLSAAAALPVLAILVIVGLKVMQPALTTVQSLPPAVATSSAPPQDTMVPWTAVPASTVGAAPPAQPSPPNAKTPLPPSAATVIAAQPVKPGICSPISVASFNQAFTAENLALGSDGAFWFPDETYNLIGRVTMDGHVTACIPGTHGMVFHMVAGSDGNLWFTETEAARIGRLSPDGRITEFPLPSDALEAHSIITAPDGTLWFDEATHTGRRIGHMTLSGHISEFPATALEGEIIVLAAIRDGSVLFSYDGVGPIERLSASGIVTQTSLPVRTVFASDPRGVIWYLKGDQSAIGRFSLNGLVDEFPISDTLGRSSGAEARIPIIDSAGNIWFAVTRQSLKPTSTIARMTPDGRFTQFPLPMGTYPSTGCSLGSDGAIWLFDNSKIGRLAKDGSITEFPLHL